MKKSRVQLVSIIILLGFAISLLLSQKASPNFPQFFGLKRVQEKVFLSLKSSPSEKVDYMSSMLNNRLGELQDVLDYKNYGYVLPSASRYSTLAGQITDLIIANDMIDKINDIRNQFLAHQKVLDALYIAYPKNTDNMEYKYIQDDFNYLKLYLDKLEAVK